MAETTILQTQDPQLNAALLVALISPAFLQDYELKEDGLHCFFTQPISEFQLMIKTFLVSLYEITGTTFYFEIPNDHEAILKIYGVDGLRFSQDILFKQSVS